MLFRAFPPESPGFKQIKIPPAHPAPLRNDPVTSGE